MRKLWVCTRRTRFKLVGDQPLKFQISRNHCCWNINVTQNDSYTYMHLKVVSSVYATHEYYMIILRCEHTPCTTPKSRASSCAYHNATSVVVPHSVGQPSNMCDNLYHKTTFWRHFLLSHKFDNVLSFFSNPKLARRSAPIDQIGVSLLLDLSLAKQPLLIFSFPSLGWYESRLRVVMCIEGTVLPKNNLQYWIWS